ncbi:MAG: hypothetical protein WDO24_04765 [Pseudomonadota bacterium]
MKATYAGGTTLTSAATTLTVTNTAPTASLVNSGPVNEGGSATVTVTNPSDPSAADTAAGFTYGFDFNNDGTIDLTTTSATVTIPTQYVALPGTDTIRATITDKDGAVSTTNTTTITINAVPPTLVVTGASTTSVGATYALNLSSTDPAPKRSRPGWSTGTATVPTSRRWRDPHRR